MSDTEHSYSTTCDDCGERISSAAAYCQWCGAPVNAGDDELPVGIGAVLYEDRPDTPADERRLHHVVDIRRSRYDERYFYVIEDGTHTTRRHYHAADLLADFAPAGWQWPTSRKPTYHLTRRCGVDDRMDLMTDGGTQR